MDELRITALGVGHGDAILLRWTNQERHWTCLIDGGPSRTRLLECLEDENVRGIDLLVLTHLDSDHVGGLIDLVNDRPIHAFWGPVLAAFERHRWLFGRRAVEAVNRGRALEDSLRTAGVDICYPMEGFASAPIPNLGKLSVLSPPARLIRRLLIEDDVSMLLSQQPMPLGWLFESDNHDQDQTVALRRMDEALARGFLTPSETANIREARPPSTEDASSLAREWGTRTGEDPEFFGDSALNNTSLVLYLEAYIGGRLQRALFAGDQENWTYLLARNPRGLQAEVLKASHHGGRVYLESDLAYEEIFSSVQPRAVIFSANGNHKLPRSAAREAAIRWGATVVCTSQRRLEFVTGTSSTEECCHTIHDCDGSSNVTVTLDSQGIRCAAQACHSGLGRQLGPIIQVRQHIVQPSTIVGHLFDHEMRRHINWIKERLISIHSDRIAVAADLTAGSIPVTEGDLATIARSEGRASLVPHLRNVLEEGMRRDSFWASPSSDYSRSGWQAYPIPSQSEVQSFMDALANKTMILFPWDPGEVVLDRDSVVNRLDFIGIAEYGDGFLHLPTIAFKDALWPHVARAFKGPKWHFYRHKAGMVALSIKADAEELLVSLIDSSIRERYQGITVDIDLDLLPFQAPALVSGKDKKGNALDRYDAKRATTRWMQVHKDDIPWDEYRRIPKPKRTYSGETTDVITEDALYKYAECNSRTMASILTHAIDKFW